jgi:hypothetical protein
MRLTIFAIFALGTAAFAQHRSGGSGSPVHTGPRIGVRRSFGGGAVYVPYPVYGLGYGAGYNFDGFYATDNSSSYGPEPYGPGPGNYDPAAYPPTPTVIINQNFQTEPVHPQLRDYSNVPLPEPGTVMVPPPAQPPPAPALADDQPTVFLIAMNDHTILPVIAYWVEGSTLHYVTLQSVPNQVSLDKVDRDFSRKLNADRHVPFALPVAR